VSEGADGGSTDGDAATVTDGGAPPAIDASAPKAAARLKVQGKDVLGPDGKPVVLRGWNWGNWGTWQPQDPGDHQMQGATIVRLPIRWWGDYPAGQDARLDGALGHMEPGHLMELDHQIQALADKHIWVDIFVDSNCGQASTVHDTVAACGTGSDGAAANFANDADAKQKYLELWSFLADHYKDQPYIAMYELLAEPNFGCNDGGGCKDWTAFPKFYAQVIPVVRAKDPVTPILVGTGSSYSMKRIDTALIPGVGNLIYTGDILSHEAADPASVTVATQFRDSAMVPIFVQQVGVKKSDADAQANLTQTLTALEAAGIGWTWWTYREPHAPLGGGFAPWYSADAQTWTLDKDWLAQIDAYFVK
jgi:hypothetical protein